MRMFSYPLFLAYLLLIGCSSPKGTTSSQPGKYVEDLSVVRPKIETKLDSSKIAKQNEGSRTQTTYVEPVFNVNKQLDEILDSISRLNLSQKYLDGFTIQVYSGSKREDALTIKKQLNTNLPDIESEIQYVQPNFRVRLGKYIQRIDAQKDYMAVRKYFPNAIVTPDKIAMN